MSGYQCPSPGCHGTDMGPCRCGHPRLDRATVDKALTLTDSQPDQLIMSPELLAAYQKTANTPALRTLALWDLAEPMARLLLKVRPVHRTVFEEFCCDHCRANRQDEAEPFVHAPDCPWAPGGLIDRIRALVPEKEGP